MDQLKAMIKVMDIPTAHGQDGIHICAQLRVEGMQLENYGMSWAAKTMEQAAKHIETLENLLVQLYQKEK